MSLKRSKALIQETTHVRALAGVCGTGFLCLLFAGCGEDESKLVPVAGIVTVDGEPLADALVEFEPVPGRAGSTDFSPPSWGTTNRKGRFSLVTRFGDGAVAGVHVVKIWEPVEVVSEEGIEPGEEQERKELRPESRDGRLTFEVLKGGDKRVSFALKSTPVTTTASEDEELFPAVRAPTRVYSDETGERIPRTLLCVAIIVLWIFALTGCFGWWRYNERRMLDRT